MTTWSIASVCGQGSDGSISRQAQVRSRGVGRLQRREEFHEAFVRFYSGYVLDDGSVSSPREYLVIIGRRR